MSPTENESKQRIAVFVGMQKNNRVHVRSLIFNPEIPLTLDLIFASVVMRHRQIVKGLFNTSNYDEIVEAAKPMQIEGLYKIDSTEHYSCLIENIHKSIQGETLIFFLNQDGVWMMNGYCDTLSIEVPAPVIDVFRAYYKSYYPQEVLDFAFKDPKQPKRVYQVDEYDGKEDFLFEPIFQESDIIEHVVVEIRPNESEEESQDSEEPEKKVA